MDQLNMFDHLYPPNKGTLFEGNRTLCDFAKTFLTWAEKLLAAAKPTSGSSKDKLITIRQAKLALLDRYFEHRGNVPKEHRNKIGDPRHVCIFAVFEKTYEALRNHELSLDPLPLVEEQPPPQVQVIREVQHDYQPLYLGEEHTLDPHRR